MIEKSRFLPEHLRKIKDPVIQRNGYFGHLENLLLAMLADSRKSVRELGLRRLLKCRTTAGQQEIREFKLPAFKFDAENYIDMIDWHSTTITEPPLTKCISNKELKEMILDVSTEIQILKYPCHTQAVER
ncbi:unnamed protein product [Psylliodes chrysocephalus]|uniref:Uncharacterized protein n=1 Tax=Psylliodes chrysocephalus TaxID=3402493 RepID=A0A9P0CMK4_9CUCU|nr:unnamed protein product [Psylliodes chrysocephala]